VSHWLIEIEGSDTDLKLLLDFLSTRTLIVVQEGPQYMLQVPSLGLQGQPGTIFDDVKDLLESISGAAKTFYPGFRGIDFDKVIYVNDSGKRSAHKLLTSSPRDTRLYAFKHDDTRLSDWLEAASQDEMIARAFSIYGALEHSWKNLFMVVEVIEDDLGGESDLVHSGISSRAKLKRFKATANNFSVVGKAARHASEAWDPPSKPMQIGEARDYVRDLMISWLDLKLS
jgi:hypothetical protein